MEVDSIKIKSLGLEFIKGGKVKSIVIEKDPYPSITVYFKNGDMEFIGGHAYHAFSRGEIKKVKAIQPRAAY